MTYAVLQDMIECFGEDELIQLTDHQNTGTVDTTVLGRALTYADSVIDGLLPAEVTESVPLLTQFACDIARWRLHESAVSEHVQKRYDEAMRYLRDVAAGRATLGKTATATETPTVGSVSVVSPAQVFTSDALVGF